MSRCQVKAGTETVTARCRICLHIMGVHDQYGCTLCEIRDMINAWSR